MSYKLSLEQYAGKVAVVTGASAGIGKAIVEELVKNGVIVAAIARRLDRLEELAKQLTGEKGKVHSFKCDLGNQEEILTTFQKITVQLGAIHILINNAGMARITTILDGDIEKWKSTIDVNLLAASICIREAVSNMKSRNIKGHIININSLAGHIVPDMPLLNIYSSTKHALRALTETVRLEINKEKLPIKITSISPGFVDTEFAAAAYGDDKRAPKPRKENHPVLISEDLAAAVFYVLSTPDHVNVKEVMLAPQGSIY